nr:hypothetical protein [Eubacterium sp.]
MAKEFKLGSQTIKVSDGLEKYNELRYEFSEHADAATNRFNQLYVLKNASLEDLAVNCEGEADEALRIPVVESIRHMIPQGIYDIDEDIFLSEYSKDKNIPIKDVCNKYIGIYNRIKAEQEMEKQARSERRANRGGLLIGGFGISGMLKAKAISVGYDAATWVAHSAVNAVGNTITDIEASAEESQVFNDPNTKKEFLKAMWESAFDVHYAYLKMMEERTNEVFEKFSPEDERRAQAINNNIALILPDRDTEEKMAVQMLTLSPYDVRFYANLIRNYGDKNGEIQKIGEFFHIDIDQLKKELMCEYASESSLDGIDSSDNLVSALAEKADYYGLNSIDKKRFLLEEKVEFDNKQYSCLFDSDVNMYLSDDISKKELLTALTQAMKNMRNGVSEIFDKYYDEKTPHIFGPDSLPNGVWFALSDNSEVLSSVIFAARDGLHFGRQKMIPYININSIEFYDHRIVINEAIRLRYRAEDIDTDKLKCFLEELVGFFNGFNTSSLVDALGMKDDGLFSDAEQKKVLEIFEENQKGMWRIYRNINVFNPSDPSHVLALKNIKSRWNVLQSKEEPISPIFWTWAGKDHVIFTRDEICLMTNGVRIPYKEITDSECYIEDEAIQLDYDDFTLVISDEPCDDPVTLKNMINYLIKVLAGTNGEIKSSGRYT